MNGPVTSERRWCKPKGLECSMLFSLCRLPSGIGCKILIYLDYLEPTPSLNLLYPDLKLKEPAMETMKSVFPSPAIKVRS